MENASAPVQEFPSHAAHSQRVWPSARTSIQARFRVSRSSRPVHARKLNNSQRESHTNPSTSRVLNVSAGLPEYVSTRHRRNSLRHGVSRWPRVAFQMKRKAPNKARSPLPEHSKSQIPSPTPDLHESVLLHRERFCGIKGTKIAPLVVPKSPKLPGLQPLKDVPRIPFRR